MHEEIWVTKLFNDYLAGLGNAALNLVGWPSVARPWTNYVSMEIVVALLIVVVFAVLKAGLSVTKPGTMQQVFELIYEFITGQGDEAVGHGAHKYMSFFGTLFIFVLFSNLIGVIPSLEAPTMYPAVPLGCAAAVFLYYNIMGIASVGTLKYLAHFAGPIWWMAPLMIPIEIISHFAARCRSRSVFSPTCTPAKRSPWFSWVLLTSWCPRSLWASTFSSPLYKLSSSWF